MILSLFLVGFVLLTNIQWKVSMGMLSPSSDDLLKKINFQTRPKTDFWKNRLSVDCFSSCAIPNRKTEKISRQWTNAMYDAFFLKPETLF